MKAYEYKILTYFIDKYENSKYFKSGFSAPSRKIYLKISKLFPHYGKSSYFVETEKIEISVSNLFKANFILKGRSNEFGNKEVILNMNQDVIKRIYKYLNRKEKSDYKSRIIEEIEGLTTYSFIDEFTRYIKRQLEKNKTLSPYIDNNSLDDFLDIMNILKKMVTQKEEISFRKFSILVFQDSKKLELYKNKIFNIVKDFYENTVETEYDAFGCFHILRNPSQIYIKGNIKLKINSQIIDLNGFSDCFVFASRDIKELEILSIDVKRVITVENLTSFYDMSTHESMILYLGGFHNSLSRDFLVYVYNAVQSDVRFYHFGDIDAGGFYIYQDLINKTNIPFQTMKMDVSTLKKYQDYALPLSTNDVKRLKKLQKIFKDPVIDYMLLHNIKLEQEIVE
ncbi:hypothetical protein M2475_001960 [Breznakia sp. PF5-3]|uniref:Wadjet anti-phage system protein JetD domain-containing protein n=1 Tax=unclassified Breznakia TaxID=2623764 RepID=UPI002405172C|nr:MULTISPECIES: Wadjet anti-phage system protein JetD domain-containing protein [unclassified Breznakia]MDL2276824.1 DUF2220 domain-containing protein [Breznakia sp. OttesenSCG-928-G09]MDF9825513.1 hypothetical protein [Breznakia sp. PM6-1]MDF9836380.1 hypothetical protein [Breznakia sp. PF5-3]MDF9838724.1 hypothetical protein [Breznakia sp. PFB2-8]MDF9860532.1 hypothetical protein [Breznakia sp. PH5-24]